MCILCDVFNDLTVKGDYKENEYHSTPPRNHLLPHTPTVTQGELHKFAT